MDLFLEYITDTKKCISFEEDASVMCLVTKIVNYTGIQPEFLTLNNKGNPLVLDYNEKISSLCIEAGDTIQIKNCSKLCIIEKIKNHEIGLQMCPKWAKNDTDIVLQAIDIEGGSIIKHASKTIKNMKSLVIYAIKNDFNAFFHCSQRLKNDINVASISLEKSWSVYPFLPEKIKENRELTFNSVAKNGMLFCHVPDLLRLDKELAKIAVQENNNVYQYLPSALKYNIDIKKIVNFDEESKVNEMFFTDNNMSFTEENYNDFEWGENLMMEISVDNQREEEEEGEEEEKKKYGKNGKRQHENENVFLINSLNIIKKDSNLLNISEEENVQNIPNAIRFEQEFDEELPLWLE